MPADGRALEAWRMLIGIAQAAHAAAAQPAITGTIPFTLVSGFLGSGKTTLITNVLETPSSARIAILVNDFGAISIDAALIRHRTPYAIELANGCVCCDLSNGLAGVLADQLSASEPPEAIILEASGVAEPLGILHVALSYPRLRLGGVITVADAETLPIQAADGVTGPTVERQIAAADIVVLNKVDLAGPEGLAAARRMVRAIAPDARIVATAFARVPPEILLDTELRTSRDVAALPGPPHQAAFSTWTFTSERALDERLLGALAAELPDSVLRAKGLVQIARDPSAPHLLQVVGRRWNLTREGAWHGSAPGSRIVLVGHAGAMDLAALEARFRACEIAPTSPH